MKSGVGDPFDTDEESDQPAQESEEQAADEAAGEAAETEEAEEVTYPLKLRRNNVKDERPNVHQLFVQDSTDAAATAAERDLEDRLGEDLYRLDAREAIYLAGIQNLDDAEEILREWGYDL